MNIIDSDSFSQKLKNYDEAFDFYMECGKLPDNLFQEDLLGNLIKQTIQDNPQLESQDPLWTELLKEELMKFIEAMLDSLKRVSTLLLILLALMYIQTTANILEKLMIYIILEVMIYML